MFNMATMLARENGVQGNLDKLWVGPDINENWSIDTMVLSPGRTRNSHNQAKLLTNLAINILLFVMLYF
jgi:hypothetical protein